MWEQWHNETTAQRRKDEENGYIGKEPGKEVRKLYCQ
jgi:hypothetical protein